MSIVWCRETARDRSMEVAKENGGSAGRSFSVRIDATGESLATILAAPGISIGDLLPGDASLTCEKISVRADGDTGLLYTVSIDYKPAATPGSSGDEEQPGGMEGLTPSWSASSSVTSEPVYQDRDGNVMCNSAGDPLEGLEAERAEFRLTKIEYYPDETTWLPRSRNYTNAVNDANWNGGNAGQWKCQGSSAKVSIDRGGEGGAARVYWEVTWEFAYKADYWTLKPWDIGFNELVDENGDPSPQYGISTGDGGTGAGSGDDGPCAGNVGRRAIKGQDGKPVKQPVALQNGVAKAPCARPDALWFHIYPEADFSVFGELFTPQV